MKKRLAFLATWVLQEDAFRLLYFGQTPSWGPDLNLEDLIAITCRVTTHSLCVGQSQSTPVVPV